MKYMHPIVTSLVIARVAPDLDYNALNNTGLEGG